MYRHYSCACTALLERRGKLLRVHGGEPQAGRAGEGDCGQGVEYGDGAQKARATTEDAVASRGGKGRSEGQHDRPAQRDHEDAARERAGGGDDRLKH